ncbi:MAG: DUF1579 family protein [Planctomycetes bacterium]|nr:DUF1579 family protein [Planctomycetota bacterium]
MCRSITWLCGASFLAMAVLLGGRLVAQDSGEKKAGAEPAGEAFVPPPIPEEMKEVEWMLGDWDCKIAMSPSPGMPEGDKSTGSCSIRKALLGMGYFEDFKGTSPMGDFEGHLVLSFDPAKKEWVAWWFDSMLPGKVGMSRGTFKEGMLTLEGEDEWDGKKCKMRNTTKKDSDTQMTFKMYMDMGEGWQESMTIVYTKKK